jgi:hypothetical protein
MMDSNETVVYLGRAIPKEYFRVFVYHENGQKKCVNSLEEFSSHINSGDWFAKKIESKKPLLKKVKKVEDE